MIKKILDYLTTNNKTISFAESCTGGNLSVSITKIPDASNVFKGSIVSYSKYSKEKIIGIEKNEISEIWVTFPDPQITYKRTKHRLTNLEFLNKYKQILNNEGSINLKTDSEFLHGYTLGLLQAMKSAEILYSNHDIYKRSGSPKEATEIKTHYENLFLNNGKPITFIKFKI